MAVLVTGGQGFIGREVVKQLRDRGEQVVVMGRNSVADHSNGVYYVRGNVAESEHLEKLFQKYQIKQVVHLAYAMDIWGDSPPETVNVNVNGFINLIEVCMRFHVKRLVWSSSVMVYGRPQEYDGLVDEESPTNPVTFYGKCKQFDEYIANHYHQKFGLDHICIRPTTVYGAGRYARGAASFLYDSVYAAVTGKKTVIEWGLAKTDMVHVKDVARACLLALDAEDVAKRTLNISGFEMSAEQLKRMIEELTGKKDLIQLLPKENNLFPSQIDRQLAKKSIGYEPLISVEEGLRDYIQRFDPEAPLQR